MTVLVDVIPVFLLFVISHVGQPNRLLVLVAY